MNIKSVMVLGQKVKVTTRTPKELVESGTSLMYMGHYDGEANLIWINKDIGDNESKMRTLFHEIGHVTMQRSGVTFSGAVSRELEEILVETNANVFYEFMSKIIKDALKEKDIAILKDKLQALI